MNKLILKTKQEICTAVDSGYTVHSDTPAYTVIKHAKKGYLISCVNGHSVGLSGEEGTEWENVLNGTEFFIPTERLNDKLIYNMRVYGGSFAGHIANAFQAADYDNEAKLLTCFRELFTSYLKF